MSAPQIPIQSLLSPPRPGMGPGGPGGLPGMGPGGPGGEPDGDDQAIQKLIMALLQIPEIRAAIIAALQGQHGGPGGPPPGLPGMPPGLQLPGGPAGPGGPGGAPGGPPPGGGPNSFLAALSRMRGGGPPAGR